jgi:hypothetical protein
MQASIRCGQASTSDEYLEAMQTLSYAEHPEYHGRFADFVGIDRAAAFAELGVHRLVVLAPQTPDGPAETIHAVAAATAHL